MHTADGWALVVPDPEEPVTHVWAEGPSRRESRQLAQTFGPAVRSSAGVGLKPRWAPSA